MHHLSVLRASVNVAGDGADQRRHRQCRHAAQIASTAPQQHHRHAADRAGFALRAHQVIGVDAGIGEIRCAAFAYLTAETAAGGAR